jgi:hypothetical protein
MDSSWQVIEKELLDIHNARSDAPECWPRKMRNHVLNVDDHIISVVNTTLQVVDAVFLYYAIHHSSN